MSYFTLLRRGISALFISVVLLTCKPVDDTPRILVFTETKGWKHSSIPAAIQSLMDLGKKNGFEVDTAGTSNVFNDDELKIYNAVVFLNTTGNVLNPDEQAAFERYIQAGGGFVGVHSAAATEYEWAWYGKLVGAHFASHPQNPGIRKGVVEITDNTHPSVAHLPAQWEREEEWYNFRKFYSGIQVVARLDETSYEGGMHGADHPIAWHHQFDGGKAFYTALGHDDATFRDTLFSQHLLGGLKYVLSNEKPDYSKAYAVTVPEDNRFVKTVLVNDLDNPMELAVSDDGKVFFTELRTAYLRMHDTRTGQTHVVHRFDVCTEGGTGLIGVTLDPAFRDNRYIYVYYSPPTDQEPIIFNLSRFVVTDDHKLDLASEKILLKVPVQENSGAHHGGSLAWDKEGNLYLSTGDSTTPFPANGYAPLDERAGGEFFSQDAQRASSNTNDLKGKILRIHPEADGTYTIPEGNLFPKGTPKTLPEIYAMGCRNPYRIAVNPQTSTVYWGEIGPDAGEDSPRGPRGYDEFNQAKKPGNYGWPYFVGNNYAYAKWDFTTNTPGALFSPASPVNRSPNNTGLEELPPAIPAMIYYPYAASKEFPELGQGGRSAMAGEFYQYNDNASAMRIPEYYDGALFAFDWMRNWVIAIRFDEEENYVRNEQFMPSNGDFRRPIDLAFSRDGLMYMLEYGSVYGADNDDARLVVIGYNAGNRKPEATAGVPDQATAAWNKQVFLTSENHQGLLKAVNGAIPLTVNFVGARSRDLDDNDRISYQWNFGDGSSSSERDPSHTYNRPGQYNAVLTITDTKGLTDTDTVKVTAGNTAPTVNILTKQNKSFYWPGRKLKYEVKVSDNEDARIESSKVEVSWRYHPSPSKATGEPIVRQKLPIAEEPPPAGYVQIMASDCKACHTINSVSVGPSYMKVAERYKNNPDAVKILSRKIIEGGGGNWSTEHVMSAHPQLSQSEAEEMVRYILSLTEGSGGKTMPMKSTLSFSSRKDEPHGVYTLTARYTDNGAKDAPSLDDSEMIRLRSAVMRPIDADAHVGIERWGEYFSAAKHKSYVMLRSIDLTGIGTIRFAYGSYRKGEIEMRIDSYAGPVIGRIAFDFTGGWDTRTPLDMKLSQAVSGRHHIYLVFIDPSGKRDDLVKVSTIEFIP